MRRACVLLLLPIFAQCQSEVAAIRYTMTVRLWEGNGSSPVYCADGLWLHDHRVICVMQLPPKVAPDSGMPWRIVAKFGEPGNLPMATEVRMPSALAERLVALARRGPEETDEEVALAAAMVEAGIVSPDPVHREIQAIEARNAKTRPAR